MNFINTGFLNWLPLALIPLVIYLFFKKKLRHIEFSSLFLLNDLVIKQNRRVKIENIILLVVRTFMILLLIVYFSGIYFGTKIKHFDEKKTRIFIFLDTSPSMQNSNGDFTLQQTATTTIRNLVNNFPDAQIKLVTSMPNEEIYLNSLNDLQTIDKIKESPTDKSLEQILKEADSFLLPENSDPDLYNNHLFLLSDGFFPVDSVTAYKSATHNAINRFAVTDFSEIDNDVDYSIDSVKVASSAGEHSVSCYLSSNFQNSNQNLHVELYGENSKIAEQQIQFTDNHAFITINLSQAKNNIKAYLKIPEDKNSTNNIFYFKLPGQKIKSVLLVGDSLSYSYNQLKKICNITDMKTLFLLKPIPFNLLTQINLTDYDAIIISELNDLNAYSISLLSDYLKSGKSIFVLAGIFDQVNYNSLVQNKIGLPRISGVISKSKTGDYSSNYYPVTYIDDKHSLLKNVFSSGFKINSVEIFKYLKCVPDIANDEILLSTSDNPLLIAGRNGLGRSLFLATSLEKSWSNLGENGLIVPLIVNGLKYLTGSENRQIINYYSNQKIDLKQANLSIYSNDGVVLTTNPEGVLPHLQFPGFYTFTNKAEENDFIAFNSDREDYLTNCNSNTNFKKNFTQIKQEDLSSLERILGKDNNLAVWLLILLFCLLCAEMWLSRR